MERFIGNMKRLLEETIEIQKNENTLTLSILIKGKKGSKKELGEEYEIKDMLRIFGGLKEEVPMEININEESQKIDIMMQNKEDLLKVSETLGKLPDSMTQIVKGALKGDFSVINKLGDFSA